MTSEHDAHAARTTRWLGWVVCVAAVYVLSSGPVIGLGFWLCELTRWNGFCAVLWLYWPLIVLGHGNPIDAYIEWWVVDVFHTAGPG